MRVEFNGVNADQASQDPVYLRRYLEGIGAAVSSQQDALGSTDPAIPINAPLASAWSVTAKDGVFIVDLVPPQNVIPASIALHVNKITAQGDPNPTGADIYYQLQSATSTNWDKDSAVTTYGADSGDTKLHWEIRDPNQTKFWRFRSKYSNSTWSPWTTWIDPLFCGPVAVWSGLLRTASAALVNSAATTVDGTNPITQDGTTTNILIAGKDWNVGPQVIHYNGGAVDPGSYGKWQISLDDPTKAGGNVVYRAWNNNGPLTAADGRLWIGEITTSAGGGGTGSGGGGGGGCTVMGSLYKRMDGSTTPVEQLRKGDVVMGMDGGPEVLQSDPELIPNQPTFELVTANGKRSKGFSSTQDIGFDGGGFDKVFGFKVGDRIWTDAGPSDITEKNFTGMQSVFKVILDRTKTMIIDGIGCHNKMSLV